MSGAILTRGLLALSSAAALAAFLSGPASAAPTRVATPTVRNVQQSMSSNWSGYAVSGSGLTFSDVKGSWVVPTASCSTGETSYSSFWIGLGGLSGGSQGLEQTGTSSDCQRGQAVYYAWYELIPAGPVNLSLPVSPGNTITADVAVSGSTATFTLTNATTGAIFSKQLAVPSLDVSSAEWIAEAPSSCFSTRSCRTLPLANFGSVPFSAASATANGQLGTISATPWSAVAISLRATAGSFGAAPSALSADGTSFAITTSQAAPATAPTSGRRPWWWRPFRHR